MVERRTLGLGELMLAGLLWGGSFPVIKYGLNQGIDSAWLVMLRFSVAAVVCLLLLWHIGGMKRLSRVMFSKPLWIIGAFNGLAFVFQYHGLIYTTASKSSLLINMNVVFVAFLGAFLLKERLTPKILAGIGIALGGIFLLTTEGDLSNLAGGSAFGDLLQVLAALTWAFYIIDNKRIVDKGLNTLDITVGMLLVTFIISMPYSLYRLAGGAAPLPSGAHMTLALVVVYTAIGGSIAAYFLYSRGVKHVPAVVSAVFLMFEIVSAMIISFIFLGERIGAYGIVGGVAILAAIVIVSLNGQDQGAGEEDKNAGIDDTLCAKEFFPQGKDG
ncbi:MAG: DMT family transporter [Candidatus Thermoplasmatota archaeon]|nr:DMT family transporter [Candidatus Thermoplasmatota archaeon]